MRKAFLFIVITLCLLPFAFAGASQALIDELVYEDDEIITGVTLEALQIEDGMLLVGASEYMDNGWIALFDQGGKKVWTYSAESSDIFSCPSSLADGGFSVLLNRNANAESESGLGGHRESALLFLNKKGKAGKDIALPQAAEWFLTGKDGYYVIGNQQDADGGALKPSLLHLDKAGSTVWHLEYANPDYSDMVFQKGVMAGGFILIFGKAYDIQLKANVGILHLVDEDGNVIWNTEAALGSDSFINDVCMTEDGMIAGIYTDISYDEEDDAPTKRQCSVFCMNMEGKVLWEHAIDTGKMLDYILPTAGGFLFGSRGLDLENCPYIGDGWLLLLDREGRVKAPDSTPDIGGGKYELFGMSKGIDSKALLYGNTLDEPGFPGLPFVAALDFPEAYQ